MSTPMRRIRRTLLGGVVALASVPLVGVLRRQAPRSASPGSCASSSTRPSVARRRSPRSGSRGTRSRSGLDLTNPPYRTRSKAGEPAERKPTPQRALSIRTLIKKVNPELPDGRRDLLRDSGPGRHPVGAQPSGPGRSRRRRLPVPRPTLARDLPTLRRQHQATSGPSAARTTSTSTTNSSSTTRWTSRFTRPAACWRLSQPRVRPRSIPKTGQLHGHRQRSKDQPQLQVGLRRRHHVRKPQTRTHVHQEGHLLDLGDRPWRGRIVRSLQCDHHEGRKASETAQDAPPAVAGLGPGGLAGPGALVVATSRPTSPRTPPPHPRSTPRRPSSHRPHPSTTASRRSRASCSPAPGPKRATAFPEPKQRVSRPRRVSCPPAERSAAR